MSAPASRRGFLRGLTTLPLIGGGVALIGAPSGVAAPVTASLLREYHDWLMFERSGLVREMLGEHTATESLECWRGEALAWHRERMLAGLAPTPPSTRAALVLAAVGCGWGEGSSWR